MSLLRPKNIYKEKIEAKFAPINTIDFTKEQIDKNKSNEKKKNSTLMIGQGVKITGNISADNEVIIQGSVEGDVECDSIHIDQSGKINGNIKSKTMNIEGAAEGEVNVEDVLTIKSDGKLSGKICYGRIQIEEGGQLSGETSVAERKEKETKPDDWKAL